MKGQRSQYTTLAVLATGILALFVVRTALARNGTPPRLDDLFMAITLVGSVVVLIRGHRTLRVRDWVVALLLGGAIGLSMSVATLFTPYPFFGIVGDHLGQALVRGIGTAVALLGGLVVMRQGGPVQLSMARGGWGKVGKSLVLGIGVGAPLAVLNIFALRLTQGQSIRWQSPLAALVDALQPAVVEEVIYRFAFLGLLWLALSGSQPKRAGWLAGLLALLVHNFSHFDDLFVQAPLVALGMGLVMALLWGLPPTLLALRRDLDSAIAFHWIQDATRFLAGF